MSEKKWIRNKHLVDDYGEAIKVRNYEAPNGGLIDKGPVPGNPMQHMQEIVTVEADTAHAIQQIANSLYPVTREASLTVADIGKCQAVRRAAIQCHREGRNYIALDQEEYDWLLNTVKADKLILPIFGNYQPLIREAFEDLLRPEERKAEKTELALVKD